MSNEKIQLRLRGRGHIGKTSTGSAKPSEPGCRATADKKVLLGTTTPAARLAAQAERGLRRRAAGSAAAGQYEVSLGARSQRAALTSTVSGSVVIFGSPSAWSGVTPAAAVALLAQTTLSVL